MPKYLVETRVRIIEYWECIIEAPDEATARQIVEDGEAAYIDNKALASTYPLDDYGDGIESIIEVKE